MPVLLGGQRLVIIFDRGYLTEIIYQFDSVCCSKAVVKHHCSLFTVAECYGRVVVVVYAEIGEAMIRIISLRKALAYERKRYEQYLKN